ncbi:MAG: hypothetical protein QM612_04525 [Thermomonas sp.]|uniref:hypothetical protein n=1 Tax=Thermomonas sp. TaxID=1971895 RepID=UPI0039E24DCF
MRQVFTSPRLENVEAVAALLREADIEVAITNDRSYRGNRRSDFSYRQREQAGPQPAVWIVRAEDQPRGRQLLRDAGLLDSSREGASSYLPTSMLHEGKKDDGGGRSMRTKLILLGLIGVVVALVAFNARKYLPAADEPARPVAPAKPALPALVPESVEALEVYRADVPTALSKLVIERALAERKPARACIDIDGKPPAPGLVASTATKLLDATACPSDGALAISVRDYMTDGSGSGTVTLVVGEDKPRVIETQRDGMRWQVQDKR